jgi:hypothetical protein
MDAAPAPRQRQPIKQIGQLPYIEEPQIYHQKMADPAMEAAAMAQGQAEARDRVAAAAQERQQKLDAINAGDPYLDEDGRWKKDQADPNTGAVNQLDLLDSGVGKADPRTGDVYISMPTGPRKIGTDVTV